MREVPPCPEWEKHLSCTHPEDLSTVEQIALKAHLATCSACARTRADYLETDDLLRSLPPIAPLPSLPTQILLRRKAKVASVVYSSVPLSLTARIVARHVGLRLQQLSSEALNSIFFPPSTPEDSDQAGQTSSQPLQETQLTGRRSRRHSLLVDLVALLVMVGIVAGFWGFTVFVNNFPQTANHSTGSTLTPTLTPPVNAQGTPSLKLALRYHGTIDELRANVPSPMSLAQTQQKGGAISGTFSALQITGAYTGFLDASKHIYFTVAASRNLGPLYFYGVVRADGSISGQFCEIGQDGQCLANGVFGVWSVAPAPAP
jgi:hypothetical protein